MPVCSRCTGIYLSFIVSLILVSVMERRLKSGICSKKVIIALIAFFSIMVIDVFLSMLKIFPPDTDNAVRFITGFSVGWFLPLLLHPLKNSLMFKPNTISCDVYLSGRKNFIAWVFAGIIFSSAFLLTYANRYILLVFSAVAVTGLIAFLAELLAILLFASAKKLKDSISSRLRYASYSAVSVLAACSFILASGSLKHLAEKI